MNTPDDDLRQLFADATSDIRPQGSLDDILDRTKKVDPMTRRWFLPVVAAAAVIGFVISGAVWIAHDSSSPKNGAPSGPPTTGVTTGVATTERAVPVYFVGDAVQDKRLYREFQKRQVCGGAVCLLEASAKAAVAGSPEDGDYSNPWPEGADVLSAKFDGDMITIDLTGPHTTGNRSGMEGTPASSSGISNVISVQQLIYSAQAGLGKGRVPVQLLLDGKHAPVIMGVNTSEPLAAADELDVLAPVQITSPANGATVKAGSVTIEGVAATFEANVVWEILVGGDAVVKNGHTTAAECCKLAPYSFTVDLEPGSYTIVVHDEDMSGSGRPVNQDTKDIVVD